MKNAWEKFINTIKKKWLRDTSLTILLIAIIIAAFIGINLLVEKLELTDIDVTADKLYTLSEESKKQVANIEKNVQIQFLGAEENSYEVLIDLAKKYTKENEKIGVEFINITERPDLVQEYSITDTSSLIIIIKSGDREQLLTESDLYTIDYTTYEQIDISEQKLTNGIISVTIEEEPVIYFLTGHNEYSVESHMTVLQSYLINEVNKVETLNLLVTNKIPEDCKVLAICSPENDFTEYEANLIKEYINNGGKILWLQDADFSENTKPKIQSVLDLYGVTISNDGIVFEQDTSKMAMQTPNLILPSVEYTDFTSEIATDGGVMLYNASRINLVDSTKQAELGLTVQNLLTTSEESFYRTNLYLDTLVATNEDEKVASTVGVMIDKEISEEIVSTLIVFSNNLFATDYGININSQQVPAIYLYNNKDLVLNSISKLSQREDTIIIRKDTGTVTTYTMTEMQANIVLAIIFGMPVLIIIAGIIVWQKRRRKK